MPCSCRTFWLSQSFTPENWTRLPGLGDSKSFLSTTWQYPQSQALLPCKEQPEKSPVSPSWLLWYFARTSLRPTESLSLRPLWTPEFLFIWPQKLQFLWPFGPTKPWRSASSTWLAFSTAAVHQWVKGFPPQQVRPFGYTVEALNRVQWDTMYQNPTGYGTIFSRGWRPCRQNLSQIFPVHPH